MKSRIKTILISVLLYCLVYPLSANEAVQESNTSEEYQVGVMVKEIDIAIDTPDNPASLEIITKYGIDSRYYVCNDSWLVNTGIERC